MEIATGTTTATGGLADISSLPGLSKGFAALSGVSADGAASTEFVLGPAGRDPRLPFDSISCGPRLLEPRPLLPAQSQK
jgi:hypothetical protein